MFSNRMMSAAYLLLASDLYAQNHSDAFGEGLQALGVLIVGRLQQVEVPCGEVVLEIAVTAIFHGNEY